jgi:hypothetical protein
VYSVQVKSSNWHGLPVHINGFQLEVVQEIKHLGTWFQRDGSDIAHRRINALAAFELMAHKGRRTWRPFTPLCCTGRRVLGAPARRRSTSWSHGRDGCSCAWLGAAEGTASPTRQPWPSAYLSSSARSTGVGLVADREEWQNLVMAGTGRS